MFVCNIRWHGKGVLQGSINRFSFIWIPRWRPLSILVFPSLLCCVTFIWKRFKGFSYSLDTFMTPSFSSFSACLSSLTHGMTAVPPLVPLTESPSSLFHKLHLQGCYRVASLLLPNCWLWDNAVRHLRAKLTSFPVLRDATTCYLCCWLPPCCFFEICADFIFVKHQRDWLNAQVLSLLILWLHWSTNWFGPLFFHHFTWFLPTS